MSAPIAAWGASIALTGCGLGYVCGHSAATGHPPGPRLASRLLALCHVLLSATCVLAWHGTHMYHFFIYKMKKTIRVHLVRGSHFVLGIRPGIAGARSGF